MTGTTAYTRELDKVMALARQAIAVPIDVDLLRDELSKLEALAPVLAPSEWMRGGAENLDQQRILIEGVAPFLRAVGELREIATSRLRVLADRAVHEAEEAEGTGTADG